MNPASGLGQSSPLGASLIEGGLNFIVYSCDAALVELLLFDHEDYDRLQKRCDFRILSKFISIRRVSHDIAVFRVQTRYPKLKPVADQ